ncbi:uncharacterized protein DS421_4g130140 [Arachis hypogaea]|nr:uncharacterized protein DS421_4g130140 [Arachis hypogaea]
MNTHTRTALEKKRRKQTKGSKKREIRIRKEWGRISRRAVTSPSPRRAAAPPCPRRRAHSVSVTPPGLLVDLPVAVGVRAMDDSEGEDARLVEPHPVPVAPPPLHRCRIDRRRGSGLRWGERVAPPSRRSTRRQRRRCCRDEREREPAGPSRSCPCRCAQLLLEPCRRSWGYAS